MVLTKQLSRMAQDKDSRAKEELKAWEFLAESQGDAGWLSFHIVQAKTVLMSAQGNDASTASEQTPPISHID